MSGWRVWLAFERRPGITIDFGQDRALHWRELAESCRGSDGKIDAVEFDRWMTVMIELGHLWGYA
jgi:hypothetical protein